MASISQGLVLTTAMLVSSTVLYLAFSRPKTPPQFQITENSNPHSPNKRILRSCLYSEEKKRNKKKKKRVKFSENVMVKEVEKESDEENREERRKQSRASSRSNCRNETKEIRGMPANRIALYNGILRDRGHRIACCH